MLAQLCDEMATLVGTGTADAAELIIKLMDVTQRLQPDFQCQANLLNFVPFNGTNMVRIPLDRDYDG